MPNMPVVKSNILGPIARQYSAPAFRTLSAEKTPEKPLGQNPLSPAKKI